MNKIRLNFAAARSSILAAGIITVPGLLPETIAGSIVRNRKVLCYFSAADLAEHYNFNIADHDSVNGVLIDHADLPSRTAGAYFENFGSLQSFIDFDHSDLSIDHDVSDVGTVLTMLPKSMAMKLGFKPQAEPIDDSGIVGGFRGISADHVMDMAQDSSIDSIDKATLGGFFGAIEEHLDDSSILPPQNGHDTAGETLAAAE